jgi:CRISPR-associated endoribonuclease Cas6
MRVRVIFELKNKGEVLPFHHQHILTEFVNDILKDTFATFKHIPKYNFSGLKGHTQISLNGLSFSSSKITLVFSSLNEQLIRYFVDTLFSLERVQIDNLVLRPENVLKELTPAIQPEMKYISLSPIVISDVKKDHLNAKKFISPQLDVFSDLIYESTIARMENFGIYSTKQLDSFYKFQVFPDENYLKKIKDGEKKFARIYTIPHQSDKLEVRGYTMPFTLFAAKEVHEFIFNVGLGYFTQNGFGMLDIANNDHERRTRPYEYTQVENSNKGVDQSILLDKKD